MKTHTLVGLELISIQKGEYELREFLTKVEHEASAIIQTIFQSAQKSNSSHLSSLLAEPRQVNPDTMFKNKVKQLKSRFGTDSNAKNSFMIFVRTIGWLVQGAAQIDLQKLIRMLDYSLLSIQLDTYKRFLQRIAHSQITIKINLNDEMDPEQGLNPPAEFFETEFIDLINKVFSKIAAIPRIISDKAFFALPRYHK